VVAFFGGQTLGGERSIFALLIPSLDPLHGTQGDVCTTELFTRSKLFALCLDTTEIVDVVLPAVAHLILVGEASIKSNGFQFSPT